MLKDEVLFHFTNAKRASAALGISTVAIYRWGAVVPKLSAQHAQSVTHGALRVRDELYDQRGRPLKGAALRAALASLGKDFVDVGAAHTNVAR